MLTARLRPFFEHKGNGSPQSGIQTGSLDILFLSNWYRGCHCCNTMVLPPNIQGPFSRIACISVSDLKRKIMKPFEVVITSFRPLCFQACEAIVLTV